MSDSEEDAFPVRVVTSDTRGRDYAATRALAAGEVVLRVAPLAAVPADAAATAFCCGCFGAVGPDRTCSGCSQVALCPACAEPASYAAALHREECSALRLLFNSPHTRRLAAGTARLTSPVGRCSR